MYHFLPLLLLLLVSPISSSSPSPASFGHGLLKEFMLDPLFTNLNHGSYGMVPRSILEDVHKWQALVEYNPDAWFRYDVFPVLTRVRTSVAAYIAADDADDVVLVDNASHGVNAVLRSVLESSAFKGKRVLYLSTAYGMVKNTLNFTQETFGFNTIQVPITFPTTSTAIIAAVTHALATATATTTTTGGGGGVGLCSFSHITSTPAIVLPIAALAAVCKQYGALVLVDGAHAPGQIDVQVGSYNEDFYVGNFHKWMYSPKGTAFLWVSKPMQKLIQPTTISWEGQGTTPFTSAFSYEGTNDYAPWMAIDSALTWRKRTCTDDDSVCKKYMHELAVTGGQVLADAWHSSSLTGSDHEMIGAMVNVIVPMVTTDAQAKALTAALFKGVDGFRTWVPVFPVAGVNNTTLYVMRVSAQIYNELSDFHTLAAATLKVFDKKE